MRKEQNNDLLLFFVGIVLLATGMLLLTKRVYVHTNFSIYGFWGMNTGLVFIPLIIGIVWYFIKPDSVMPKIVIVLAAIAVFVTIIMNTTIQLYSTSLFDYLLIIILCAVGVGLILRIIFKSRN